MKVLLSGGSSGLGEVIAKKILEREDLKQLIISYRTAPNPIFNGDARVEQVCIDFSDSNLQATVDQFTDDEGFDVLINNAWESFDLQRFEKMNLKIHSIMMENSLLGTLTLSQQIILGMKKAKKGRIINVLSAYLQGDPPMGVSHYVGSKAYLEAVSRSWKTELKKFRIGVFNVYPGPMRIGMNKDLDERILEMMALERPSGKLVTGEEVANGINNIIDWDISISGESLIID